MPEVLPALNKMRLKGMTEFLSPIVKALALSAGVGGIGYLNSKREQKQAAEHLAQSMITTFKENPEFKKDTNLFKERFKELALVAPGIAGNPQMAAKVLSTNMKDGFSVDDIHKLTMIQTYGNKPTGQYGAEVAGRLAAINAFDKILTVIGPKIYEDTVGNAQSFMKWSLQAKGLSDEIRRKHGMDGHNKTSAERTDYMERKVSDECIGEMLGERYCMAKTAGLFSSQMATGAKALKNSVALMLPVLALSGIAAGAGALVDQIKQKKLHDAADKAFDKVRKESDHIRGNPVLAAEAFDAMRSFAPSLAEKPQVLKTFIEHVIRTEQLAPQTINDLASAQSNVNKSQESSGFAAGLANTLKVPISIGESAVKFVKGKGDNK